MRHWRAHEARTSQLRQGIKRCAHPQFRELAAAHHLQQLHDEFDFAYAATRDLDVIGAFGPARATGDGMVADLVMQHPQRFVYVEIEIAAENEWQDHLAQQAP